MKIQIKYILNIPFLMGGYPMAIESLREGGLMVVPAAPAIAEIYNDDNYYSSLKQADFALVDSGFMVLAIRLIKNVRLVKLSGYAFLEKFLKEKELQKGSYLFLVDPSKEAKTINNKYLRSRNIMIEEGNHYCAPFYNKKNIVDYELLSILSRKKPKYIMINLGGGVQERLGLFLKKNLGYKPGIICTGAAIAFFTGEQVKMSGWVDKFYLGWLFRIISKPSVFLPRYLKGFKLYEILRKREG